DRRRLLLAAPGVARAAFRGDRAMARYTSSELEGRLRLDYRVAMAMRCEIMGVWAYRTAEDLEAGRRAISDEGEAHQARHYRVWYRVRTLSGPGAYTDDVDVSIDLLAGGNYPFTEPYCLVRSRPMPWSPHF